MVSEIRVSPPSADHWLVLWRVGRPSSGRTSMREKRKKGTRLTPGIRSKIPTAKSSLLASTRRAIGPRFPSNIWTCRSGCLSRNSLIARWKHMRSKPGSRSNQYPSALSFDGLLDPRHSLFKRVQRRSCDSEKFAPLCSQGNLPSRAVEDPETELALQFLDQNT